MFPSCLGIEGDQMLIHGFYSELIGWIILHVVIYNVVVPWDIYV